MAAPGRRVRRRRADGLLRPLQRIVLRRARPPVAVRGCEQQVLDDALALVHRRAHHRRLPRAGAHRAGRDRRRRRLVRRLRARPARGPGARAGGGAERLERAGGSEGRFPLPRRAAGAASRRGLHEHDQLLQLLHLRDLRPLREPHARAERRRDRADPRRGLVRRARGSADRPARGAEARDRPRGRRRLGPVPGPDGALPARARVALAERHDAAGGRVPGERRRDDLRRQPEQPDADADPARSAEPGRRRLAVLQLRHEAVRGAARRRARGRDRAAGDAVGRGARLPARRRCSSWPRRCRACGRRTSRERLQRPQKRPAARARRRGGDLDDRLSDDLGRAAVVRAHDLGLGDPDERRGRRRGDRNGAPDASRGRGCSAVSAPAAR